MNLKSFINTIKPLSVTIGGAAFSGAAIAAKQYIASGGSVTDYRSLGFAAALGGLSALGALYVKPPASAAVLPQSVTATESSEFLNGGIYNGIANVAPPLPPNPVAPVVPQKS
jgi:hypothetical protein